MPRSRNRGRDLGYAAEINVTSLVDVALTLLVIFIITAPMMQGGIEVSVPRARTETVASPEGVVISVDRAGDVYIGQAKVSWEEFAAPGAPPIDYVFTVCDNAASEACPVWPGHPVSAHWGVEDPAAVNGSDEEKRSAFRACSKSLKPALKAARSDVAALSYCLSRLYAHARLYSMS